MVERQISSPHIAAIVDYWHLLRKDRAAPQIYEVDPVELPRSALPYVMLADLQRRPFRVRYRLVGTHVTNLVGGDFAGRFLDQLRLPAGVDELMTQDYAWSAWMCEPVIGTYPWPKIDGKHAVVQYCITPLLSGDAVTRFLCAEHIHDDERGGYLYAEDLVEVPWRDTAA